MVFSFVSPPILQLISFFTRAALERCHTFLAHQATTLNPRHVVLVLSVELEAAEDLQALLALVLLVSTRCVSAFCATLAHQVSVVLTMILNHLPVPSACIEDFFASRAPVVVEGQVLVPVIVAFETSLASCGFLLVRLESSSF